MTLLLDHQTTESPDPQSPALWTDELVVRSTLLGDMAVLESQLYRFPGALYGFPSATMFALLPAERAGFYWLQSTELPALTFLLVDPFLFMEEYAVDISERDLATLEASDVSDVLVLSILTLPRDEADLPTLNLQGPVALDVRSGVGMQLAIDSPFGLRHPVDLRAATKVA